MSAQTRHLLPLECPSSPHLQQLLINTVPFSISGYCGCESQQTAAVMSTFLHKRGSWAALIRSFLFLQGSIMNQLGSELVTVNYCLTTALLRLSGTFASMRWWYADMLEKQAPCANDSTDSFLLFRVFQVDCLYEKGTISRSKLI